VLADDDDNKVLTIRTKKLVVLFENSDGSLHSGNHLMWINGPLNSNNGTLVTNIDGVLHREVYNTDDITLAVEKDGRQFTKAFASAINDTIRINTIQLNLHWSHDAKYQNDVNFLDFSNGTSKVMEVLPGDLNIELTNEGYTSS